MRIILFTIQFQSISFFGNDSYFEVGNNIGNEVEISGAIGPKMNEEIGILTCPICNEKFDNTPENTRILAVHVDDHFVEELKCPICNISYNIRNQREYEVHVNVSLNQLKIICT